MDSAKVVELLIQSLTALGAAYAGARYAFINSGERENAKQRDAQVEACNQAMLTLSRQFNRMLNVRAQVLDPLRDDPARHFLVHPSDEYVPDWHVNAPSLAFLAATEAHDVPFMVALLSDKFHGAMRALQARSKCHAEFQLALELSLKSAPRSSAEEMNLDEVEKRVGERISAFLRQTTNQAFDLLDDALAAYEKAGRDVPQVLRTLYPQKKVLGFAGPIP